MLEILSPSNNSGQDKYNWMSVLPVFSKKLKGIIFNKVIFNNLRKKRTVWAAAWASKKYLKITYSWEGDTYQRCWNKKENNQNFLLSMCEFLPIWALDRKNDSCYSFIYSQKKVSIKLLC